jgi:hypothetical protein
MSRLKLFSPEADVLPFSTRMDDSWQPAARGSHRIATQSNAMLEVLIRAQKIRDNRECIDCGHPIVELVELNDGRYDRSGTLIPGTATLVGFRCGSCQAEWPA